MNMNTQEPQKPAYLPVEAERLLLISAKKGDLTARNKLLMAALPYVEAALIRCYPGITHDDRREITQEVVFPLARAIELYDLDHPSRARFYVFAMARIKNTVSQYFRHTHHLSYQADVPVIDDSVDATAEVESSELITLTRGALATLSNKDQDVLTGRHMRPKATPRRVLAERYDCSQQAIDGFERRALERMRNALPTDSPCGFINTVN